MCVLPYEGPHRVARTIKGNCFNCKQHRCVWLSFFPLITHPPNMDAPPTIPTVDPPKLSSMFAQISSFNKNNMQKTTTRVRTSLGQVFEETYNSEKVVSKFVGNELFPAYLEDSLHGFTRLIPGKYDPENKKWINFIYNNNITLNTQPTQSISFISFNCWFSPIYQKERAIAFLDIVAAKHPSISPSTLSLGSL